MSRNPVGVRAVVLACLAPALLVGVVPRTGTIAGTVRDAGGAAIVNAHVTVVGTGHSATTDSVGGYRLERVRAGSVDLEFRFVGYKPTRVVGVRVVAGKTTRQDAVLEQAAAQLQELTVVTADGRKVTADRLPVSAAPPPQLGTSSLEEASLEFGNAQRGVVGAAAGHRHREQWNTENYARIYDNRFLAARSNPLSTFAIDVDRASYGNVRRFLQQGTLPPADAVRIEELINYFTYDYPEPRGEHPFSVTTEVADAPWKVGHRLVRIGLQGRRIPVAELPPSNLVFLIDVSGSMHPENKLPLVRKSLRLLVDQLRPQDRVAMVVYAGAAGLVLPSTPGTQKQRILDAIDHLDAGGSTAGAAGIRLAYDVAREHHIRGGTNRVILATDGDFNVGVSSDGELTRLIEERREQGTFLTVLGYGYGNLKDSKLELLADKGNGNYAYVDDLLEAQKVLVHEFGGTLMTLAKDVKIQVEFNPARVQAYRLIGYENRLLAKEDFDDDTKDAGELGAGHSVTALYEVVPVGVRSDVAIAEDSLRYQAVVPTSQEHGDELLLVKLRYKEPDGSRSRLLTHAVADRAAPPSADLRFASAVAAYGMLLRSSEFRGSANWAQVMELARAGRGRDEAGYRGEFLRLIELASQLEPQAHASRDD